MSALATSRVAQRRPRPLAVRLAEARQTGRPIVRLLRGQSPTDLADAYRTAKEVVGEAGVGWKIGATSPEGQAALGLQEPFFGRIEATPLASGGAARVPAVGAVIDAEVLFILSCAPNSQRRLRDCVSEVRIGLEVNTPRYRSPFALGALAIVADNGAHGRLVVGEPVTAGADLGALAFSLSVNDVEVAHGLGAGVMGDPWRALAWLERALTANGRSFAPGDIIASGAVCATPAPVGAIISGRCAGASVSVSLEAKP